MSTITLGLDLAKRVFSVCEMNGSGRVLRRLDLNGMRLLRGWRSCRPGRWWRAAAHTIGHSVAAREALARGKQDNTITSSGPKA